MSPLFSRLSHQPEINLIVPLKYSLAAPSSTSSSKSFIQLRRYLRGKCSRFWSNPNPSPSSNSFLIQTPLHAHTHLSKEQHSRDPKDTASEGCLKSNLICSYRTVSKCFVNSKSWDNNKSSQVALLIKIYWSHTVSWGMSWLFRGSLCKPFSIF